MTGLRSLSRAMFLGFVRDRTALFFSILFPLLFLVLFGGIFKSQNAPKSEVIEVGQVAVLDDLPAAAREQLSAALEITKSNDLDAALQKVRKGDVAAAIEQQGSVVVIHYSAADTVKAATVQGVMQAVVQEGNVAATGKPPTFTLQAKQVEDQSLKAIQFVTPGLLAWAIAVSATFGAALTLVTWRQKRILRRLRLSPVRVPTVVSARVGVSIGVALVQMVMFIVIASLPFFGLQLSAWWWLAVPLLVCGTLTFLAIGMLAGSFAKTPEGASGIVNLIVLPMAFLSGAFFPIDTGPQWLLTVSKLLPMSYLVNGLRNVMVRGEGPAGAFPEMAVLLGFGLVFWLIASRLFTWDD